MKNAKQIVSAACLLGAGLLIGCAEEKPKTEKVIELDVPGVKLEVNKTEGADGTSIEIKSEKK